MRWKVAAVLLFTVACLVWVLWGIPLDVVRVQVGEFRWAYYLPVCGLYLVTHGLRVFRMEWVMGRKLPFWRTFSILSIGYLALNVMPLRMGEFVRPYLMDERQDVPFGTGLACVFVERLVDVLALLGMVWLCLFWVDLPPGAILVGDTDILAAGQRVGGVVVGGATAVLVGVLAVGEPALRLTDRLPVAGPLVRRFVGGLRSLAGRPLDLARTLAITAVIWTLTVYAVATQLRAFPGMPHDGQTALIVWTATLSGMSAVPTPGFFGGFEAFCAAALVMLGVDGDAARVFAVLLHLGQFGVTVLMGVVCLVWEGVSLREVVERSRASASTGPGT